MRTRRLIPVALAAAALALPMLPATAQRAGAPTLGVDGLPVFRETGSAAVLAVAVDRWKVVSSRSEELLGDFRYLPEHASARARGQVFRVLRTDVPRIASDPGGSIVGAGAVPALAPGGSRARFFFPGGGDSCRMGEDGVPEGE